MKTNTVRLLVCACLFGIAAVVVAEEACRDGMCPLPKPGEAAELAVSPTESLQRETGEDGFTLESTLGDEGQEERLLDRVWLRQAMERLPERERQIIALRYFHDLTQEKCAAIVGVSQVQVSRLERRAMASLREMLS